MLTPETLSSPASIPAEISSAYGIPRMVRTSPKVRSSLSTQVEAISVSLTRCSLTACSFSSAESFIPTASSSALPLCTPSRLIEARVFIASSRCMTACVASSHARMLSSRSTAFCSSEYLTTIPSFSIIGISSASQIASSRRARFSLRGAGGLLGEDTSFITRRSSAGIGTDIDSPWLSSCIRPLAIAASSGSAFSSLASSSCSPSSSAIDLAGFTLRILGVLTRRALAPSAGAGPILYCSDCSVAAPCTNFRRSPSPKKLGSSISGMREDCVNSLPSSSSRSGVPRCSECTSGWYTAPAVCRSLSSLMSAILGVSCVLAACINI
mmetsp:Transcript_56441/g.138540  ORF Transcript_56441/g.138540 Transcript_56441/m.138540 type:complete len:325 (-) Transcript_56441:58-1032(-)